MFELHASELTRTHGFNRRWTFYVLLIWTGVLLISMIFLVPETYHPVYVMKIRIVSNILILLIAGS